MKTLSQHISEKLIINKNYKSVSYDFNDVKELYLIRFNVAKTYKYINIDMVDVRDIIIPKNNDIYNVSGLLTLLQARYFECEFDADNVNGILLFHHKNEYYDGVRHFDILLHPSLKENFKKLVQNCFDNHDEKYFPNDIFKILNIECPKFEDQFNVEYDYIATAYNPTFMEKLARHFNI